MFYTYIYFQGMKVSNKDVSNKEFCNKEVCRPCDVAVPTTVYRRAVPTTATEGVRPRDLGRNREVFCLMDKQGLVNLSTGIG